MSELCVSNIHWDGYGRQRAFIDIPMFGRVLDPVIKFSAEFSSGKAYGLCGHIGDGAIAASYCIAGTLAFDRGSVAIDGNQYDRSILEALGTVAWFDTPKKPWCKHQTVRQQIEQLLQDNGNPYRISGITELNNMFMLSEGRLDRPLKHYSHERWRASLAIGIAQGKRIFAVPWMNPSYARCYSDIWIRKCVEVLKAYDCWVLLPTSEPSSLEKILDEVIIVKGMCDWREEDFPDV